MAQLPQLKGIASDNFFDSLKSERTKQEYSRMLLYFARWKGVKKVEDLLVENPQKIKQDITKYLVYLKKERNL